MATIVTRAGKGNPLTNNEVDANFNNLNTEVGQAAKLTADNLLSGYNNFTASTAVKVPVGTTAQRPAVAVIGDVRYNTTISDYEGYDGTTWVRLSSGAFTGLATEAEVGAGSPPTDKAVPANLLISKTNGNRIALRSDGLYLGDEAPPEVSVIWVDAIDGVDPEPKVEYAADPRWFENPAKWQAIRGAKPTPFKTIGLAIQAGPPGINKTINLKSWQVHRLTQSVSTTQSFNLNCYGDAPSGCSLDTSTGKVTVATSGLNAACTIPQLAKLDASSVGSLVVNPTPRTVEATPSGGETDMILLYRNTTGTITRVHITKKDYAGTTVGVWRYHQDTSVDGAQAYNTWALANSQPIVDSLAPGVAGWGTYLGQGRAVYVGPGPAYPNGFVANRISFTGPGMFLTRSIGFIAAEMHESMDDSIGFNEDHFSSLMFPESPGYLVVCYNASMYGREAPYADWDMPGLLTMPTTGRTTSSYFARTSAAQQFGMALYYVRGRAQTGAKRHKFFDFTNPAFSLTFGPSSTTGYVAESGNPTGYNVKDWCGAVVKATNPVISMSTNINPANL